MRQRLCGMEGGRHYFRDNRQEKLFLGEDVCTGRSMMSRSQHPKKLDREHRG